MQEIIQLQTAARSGLTAVRARALLLDGGPRDGFDRLVRLAALALRAPIATVGVVQEDRLSIVSHVGMPEPWSGTRELPLDATFCRTAAASRDVLAVDDAAHHPLTGSVSPCHDFPCASYCGAPILVDGEAVAVLSVCDAQPRGWTADELELIRDLAASGVRDLELAADQHAPSPADIHAVPFDSVPEGVIAVDADWRFTYMNVRAEELLGRRMSDVGGSTFWDVFPGLIGSLFHQQCLRVVSDRGTLDLEDYCHSIGVWLEMRAYPSADGGAVLHLRDISQRRSAQDELRGREERYRNLFEESRTPLFVMAADGRLLEVNRAFESLLGRNRGDLQRMHLLELAVQGSACERLLSELQETGSAADEELALRNAHGDAIVCQVSAGVQQTQAGVSYHCVLRDITEQKRSQEQLERSALHDALTGLPNRVVFMDRLERMLKHSKRRAGYRFAVLFLDLDNFKAVNDTSGHLIGDELLINVARRLESCVRQEDTVARIGGDEFAVLLDMVQDTGSVILVVDRIREALAQPLVAADGVVTGTTASIGIALSVSGYGRAEDLLRDADAAMYRSKAAGRNDYMIFDSDMHETAVSQRQMESDLRAAVSREELAVHYHPVVELDGGAVTGLEALIRWQHPERGILLPAEFMPLAEQTGLIVDIGWWILREACRQLRAWQQEYPHAAFKLTMSVNLSSRQFVHPQLVQRIDEILEETGLSAHCLRLDLTEAVVMHNADLATRLLQQLRERGIQICIDDFGTGYTSLRQLRSFPISTLKIDRSFIDKLAHNDSHEIVQSIIALGRSMAIDAIAEGVETPEQLELLRRLGTRFAQGFLFSLPLDPPATTRLLQETR